MLSLISKAVVFLGVLLVLAAPSAVRAHENVGGDELAVANWMLIGALVTVLMGVLAGVWASRSGQFNNVEESKYTMLSSAEDFDTIMAEADERERAYRMAESSAESKGIEHARSKVEHVDRVAGA